MLSKGHMPGPPSHGEAECVRWYDGAAMLPTNTHWSEAGMSTIPGTRMPLGLVGWSHSSLHGILLLPPSKNCPNPHAPDNEPQLSQDVASPPVTRLPGSEPWLS